jgi:uncharacterized protein with PIN domain
MVYYRYIDPQTGESLTTCPSCQGDLTEVSTIDVSLVVNGREVCDNKTHLDVMGLLVDFPDAAIRKGFHSETFCGHCGASLVKFERRVERPAAFSVN